jgi:transposase
LPESFIPPVWQRELRDLTRLRARMSQEITRAGNRILKALEDAQIKLDCVVSDALGKSGKLILNALVAGKTNPDELIELAQGKLKKKKAELRKALSGRFTEHHRLVVRVMLQGIQTCEDIIVQLDTRIAKYLEPYEDLVKRLDAIPGVDWLGAAVILAEIGPDMSPWDEDSKLASWGCLCPGNHESAGKRLSGKTRKGNRWLRRAFCQMAWAATRKKGSYFKAQYRRLSGRRGKQKALLAVAHSIIIVVYHLVKNSKLEYRDLGEDFFDKRNAEEIKRQLVKRLGNLGWDVTLTRKASSPA